MENFDKILTSLVEDIFLTYDTNSDGFLQRPEAESFIKGCLTSMGQPYSQTIFNDFFSAYDVNCDGKLSREEMAVFVKNVVYTSVDEIYEDGFKVEKPNVVPKVFSTNFDGFKKPFGSSGYGFSGGGFGGGYVSGAGFGSKMD
jgi:Ca2+-binding EF-hand superfamily protein